MKSGRAKQRLIYGLAFLFLVAAEVIIAQFVRDEFLRPYGGDIIVIGVLYCLVRTAFPNKIKLLPLYLFAFACLVEAAQAMDYVTLLGLQDISFFRTVLGTSFSWLDILCYAVGGLLCLVPELTVKKHDFST